MSFLRLSQNFWSISDPVKLLLLYNLESAILFTAPVVSVVSNIRQIKFIKKKDSLKLPWGMAMIRGF